MLAANFKLSSLCYGHRGRLIRSLRGKFDPNKMDTVIQLGEMPCRCWVVLDGNNRIAMILDNDPDATMAVLPNDRLLLFKKNEWDRADLDRWNPNPQTFEFVRSHSAKFYRIQRNKRRFKSEPEYRAAIERMTDILEDTPHPCRSPRPRWVEVPLR